MAMNYKIAAIGQNEALFPFQQIGMDVIAPLEGNALVRQVAKLTKAGYALFFITEDCLLENPALLTAYDKHPAVSIIPIPGLTEQPSMGLERVQNMVEKALGQNIL